MPSELSSLRDFLAALPRLANYNYNSSIDYLVWRTLDQCMRQGLESVDWDEKESFFLSSNWENGAYQALQLPTNWRDAFLDKSSKATNDHCGSSCNKHCSPAETVFYCFDCTKNPLYEICDSCFDPEKHQGHRFTSRVVTRPEGRVCHCGDPSGFTEGANALLCKNDTNNLPPFQTYGDNVNTARLFEQVLDYLIDAIVFLKELYQEPNKTFMSNGKGNPDTANANYVLQLYENDCSLHVRDLAHKIGLLLDKPPEFGLMMVDELQRGSPFVILLESTNTERLKVIQDTFASENITLHLKASANVFKESLIDELINWLYKLCLNNPPLSLKLALREAMCGVWNSWLLSSKYTPGALSPFASKIPLLGGFVVPFEQRDTFPWPKPWHFPQSDDEKHDPNVLKIMQDYDKRLQETNANGFVARFTSIHGSRLQTILVEEATLLPKLSRLRILKVISCIFTIVDDSRTCIAAQYIDIYANLLYSTVASDTFSHKVSIMSSLSQHVFQVPKIANMIIPSGFIERITQFAFTLMSFSPEELTECPPVPLYRDFKLPIDMIKNKRTVVCFKDIYLLMSTNTKPELLLSSKSIYSCMVGSFAAFNNVLPVRRETSEHVEFENFEFSSYFFYFSSILVMIDGFTRNICLLEDLNLRKEVVSSFLRQTLSKELELLGEFRKYTRDFLPSTYGTDKSHNVRVTQETICNTTSDVIQFQVGVDYQNFFNPMSYFFKFVTLWSQCGRYEPLPYCFSEFFDIKDIFADEMQINWMCESALSILVLLAQVNSGFWVRNGSPIQHQARMYTKYSMREFTYFSDIFMLQLGMSIADPNNFMVSYLSRWGIRNWSEGVPLGDYPDAEITASIVDQSLLLLIQLFSEVRNLIVKSSVEGFERTMQMEIVHALCFKNSTHSDILNMIPEHITKHPAFDLYLSEMATYSPPSGTADVGIYSLKEKYLSLVDPYFIGLSSSRRYEAERIVRKKMSVKNEIDYNDTYVPAREYATSLRSGPFSDLYKISNTEIFGCFLKNTLDHINKFGYEAMLGKVTHLVHLCAVNNLFGFTNIFWKEYGFSNSECLHYGSIGSLLYSFLLKEEFSNEHGKIREVFRHFMKYAPHVNVEGFLSEQTPSFSLDILNSSSNTKDANIEERDKRKRLAKLKREKIMKRIAKQQQKFLANNQMPAEEEPYFGTELPDQVDGWTFPEVACVFCKMKKDADLFIHFSFLEKNICDVKLDFKETLLEDDGSIEKSAFGDIKQKLEGKEHSGKYAPEAFIVGPVLRTCGHGSHVTCLTDHMKSVRTAHNHITKNISSSLGFSLMFCPLCSALINSFLPRVGLEKYELPSNKGTMRNKNGFFDAELVKSCNKSFIILQSLCESESKKTSPVDVLNRIYSFTICNAEIATRLQHKEERLQSDCMSFLNNQHILTLKLISQLRKFFVQHADLLSEGLLESYTIPSPLFEIGDWEAFIKAHPDCDVLSLAADHFSRMPHLRNSSVSSTILEIVKEHMHQDLLALVQQFQKGLSEGDHFAFQNRELAPREDEIRTVTSDMESILRAYCSATSIDLPVNVLKYLRSVIQILRESMTARLRRLVALLYCEKSLARKKEVRAPAFDDLDYLLWLCDLPEFANILDNFRSTSLDRVMKAMASAYAEDGNSGSYPTTKLCSYTSSLLIDLPFRYSDFKISEDEHIQLRTKKEELAICLFCGARVCVQNAVSLHDFAIGECTDHSLNSCDVNPVYGCFLLVRSNTVYLSYGHRGTFYQAPYLNRHGETDEDYRNGSPVFFDQRRYVNLTQEVVLGNMIPHIVFRLTDNNSDLGGWEGM